MLYVICNWKMPREHGHFPLRARILYGFLTAAISIRLIGFVVDKSVADSGGKRV